MSACWWPDRPLSTRLPRGSGWGLNLGDARDLVDAVVGVEYGVVDGSGEAFRVAACATVDADGLHVRPLGPDAPEDWRFTGLYARVADPATGATRVVTIYALGPYDVGAEVVRDGPRLPSVVTLPETWTGKGPRIVFSR